MHDVMHIRTMITKTQTKHTDGPWEVEIPKIGMAKVCAKEDYQIALVTIEELNKQARAQDEANARLIAAAPELLTALKHARLLLQLNDIERIEGGSAALDMYDAAIAKAEGK